MPVLIANHADYAWGALALLLVCKGLGYGISLAGFRGGPVFPSMFLGATIGMLLSTVAGVALVPAVAMGIGAMCACMLRLPLTSVLLATLLLGSDGLAIMPVVIVAVVVSYMLSIWLAPPPDPTATAVPVPPGTSLSGYAERRAPTAGHDRRRPSGRVAEVLSRRPGQRFGVRAPGPAAATGCAPPAAPTASGSAEASSSDSSLSPSAASRLALRLSWIRVTWTDSSYSRNSAIASATHGDRVVARHHQAGEDDHPEDRVPAPFRQLRAGHHADLVQHDQQQRQLERDTEDDQHGDQEGEVAVRRQRRDGGVPAEAEQDGQALPDDDVGEHGAEGEQHPAAADEDDRVLAFLGVQRRGDERPQLVQPHRAGQHGTRDQRGLQLQFQRRERAGGQQFAAVAGARSCTRSVGGTAQYGPVRISDRLGSPIAGMPWPNQMKPITVPRKIPSTAKNNRRRSSYRCSINDIVPSGDFSSFLRRSRGIRSRHGVTPRLVDGRARAGFVVGWIGHSSTR